MRNAYQQSAHAETRATGQAIGAGADDEDEVRLVVTAIPDAERGERLIVVHKVLGLPVDAVVDRLSAMGIPNLWIPSRDSFLEVPVIPLLAAGKVDLKSIKNLAKAKVSPARDIG